MKIIVTVEVPSGVSLNRVGAADILADATYAPDVALYEPLVEGDCGTQSYPDGPYGGTNVTWEVVES